MPLAVREFDLPPKWDGAPVTWEGWHQNATTLDFHTRAEDLCIACASTRRPALNSGSVHLKGFDSPRFTAFRCLDCQHDTVFDGISHEWWDLEARDYTVFGSWNEP